MHCSMQLGQDRNEHRSATVAPVAYLHVGFGVMHRSVQRGRDPNEHRVRPAVTLCLQHLVVVLVQLEPLPLVSMLACGR